MGWLELVSTISAIIVAGAAIVVAHSAKRGLDTWQRQMRGEDEYKLARELLASLYKYRDAVLDIRSPQGDNPVLYISRIRDAKTSKEEARGIADWLLREYERKRSIIEKQKQNIYRDLIVAEALWGNEINMLFHHLLALDQALNFAVRKVFMVIDLDVSPDRVVSQNDSGAIKEILPNMYKIACCMGEDSFGQKVAQDIGAIEKYLKKKLAASPN